MTMRSDRQADPVIFVVDDDEAWLRTMRTLLATCGYREVRLFSDPAGVLTALQHQPADVLISDLSMPGLTGDRLLSEVQRRWPALPVLILTGSDSVRDCERLLHAGASQYITKPVSRADLDGRLQQVLQSRADAAALERWPAVGVPVTILAGGSYADRQLLAQTHGLDGEDAAGPARLWLPETPLEDVIGFAESPGLLAAAGDHPLYIPGADALSAEALDLLLSLVERGTWMPVDATRPACFAGRLVIGFEEDHERRFAGILAREMTTVIRLPDLAQRASDLASVVGMLLNGLARTRDRRPPTLLSDGLAALVELDLAHDIDRLSQVLACVIDHSDDEWIGAAAIAIAAGQAPAEPEAPCAADLIGHGKDLPTLSELQQALVEEALRRFKGNKTDAARALGISRQALNSRLRTLARKGVSTDALQGAV